MKKIDRFLLFFAIILGLISVLAWRFPNVGQYFDINKWFQNDSISESDFWLVIIFVMVVCFIGALIPMPVPYAIPVATFSYQWINSASNPWILIVLLCLFAALANSFGDAFDYIIGRGTNAVISKDDPALSSRWSKIILAHPKTIPFIIFLFALTPFPDSLLLVPLGFIKYSPKKALFAMYLGKFGMMMIIAVAGIFTIDPILALLGGEGSWITGVLLLWFMYLIILIMVKIKPKKDLQ
jgi:membrane protein YqaA with SNARE-associated domain